MKYGYFYVADGQVVGIHLIKGSKTPANIALVGRLSKLDPAPSGKVVPTKMNVRNVSRWMKGAWADQSSIDKMDIQQATFIKDGAVIQPSDLEINDRLFIIAESVVKGKFILVD